ncbi:MAG TPA: Stealth CR1 domain-containing protein [Saccharospirillum sp.]|nr:Stealth CR1 domain-containing protein [Saccharospirillum sp.]
MSDAAPEPIDALVTWVNGEDPAHRAKLNAYLESIGHRPKIASANRYRETGEFAYCIASLLKYAPWLRRIHILADAQAPDFMPLLKQSGWADKVVVVDHTQLFRGYEQALPTFNNRSIMSMHWNVPGLAERYVYLNDDFMLVRPVEPTCFFQDGKAVLVGQWMPQRPGVVLRGLTGLASNTPDKRPGNHLAQAYAARLAGFRFRYFKTPHKPHPLLKSVMADYMAKHPQQLAHNIKFPLRDESQFLADALVNHLALKQGLATVNNRFKTLRFKPGDYQQPRFSTLLSTIESNPSILYACFQSLETMEDTLRTEFFNWLDQRMGKPDTIFRTGPAGVSA